MRVVLEIISAPGTGQKAEVRPGQALKVGRSNQADYAIPYDTFLSGSHFSVEVKAGKCLLRDLRSSNGTAVNSKTVSEVELNDGDEVTAGRTTFKIHLEGFPETAAASDRPSEAEAASAINSSSDGKEAVMLPKPPFEDPEKARQEAQEKEAAERAEFEDEERPPLTEPQQRLLEILHQQKEPLYAVLDAARDEAILDLLFKSGEEYESLFGGESGHELRDYSPHLVKLRPDSHVLRDLVAQGWSRSWGVFLTCQSPFEELRQHLRKLLMVQAEDAQDLYFRFYDPRVLGIFLPTCRPNEATELFGPIHRFFLEGDDPDTVVGFQSDAHSEIQISLSDQG